MKTRPVRGYDDDTYGESFADVYDDWYADVSDAEALVALVASEAQAAARHSGDDTAVAVELGVGTGRLAVPLSLAGVDVIGIDTSAAMLDHLAAKASEAGTRVRALRGDMADTLAGLGGTRCHVVFVAYNTLFSLPTAERQQHCFDAAAATLSPGGRFIVEAFVPAESDSDTSTGAGPGDAQPSRPSATVGVRSVAADRVVLRIDVADPAAQRAEGQYVEITEAGGVRLRPWSIRWSTPAELDEMAARAGLRLRQRHADAAGAPFDADAERHVSVYERPGEPA
ncbi:MAG: methyltransferase domain-containing protein [Ilumatobacteraceae bacterium]